MKQEMLAYKNNGGLAMDNLKGAAKDLYEFFILTERDYVDFMENYYEGHVLGGLVKLQRERVDESLKHEGILTALYETNKKQALEGLFQEPVTECQMSHLTEANITFKELFEKKREKPFFSLPMILKTMKAASVSIDDSFLIG